LDGSQKTEFKKAVGGKVKTKNLGPARGFKRSHEYDLI